MPRKKSMRLGGGGRFAVLKKKLAARGAYSPGGLAAYIGRAKYGSKKMAAMSRAHRNPTIYKVINERSGKVKYKTFSLEAANNAVRRLGTYTHFIEVSESKGKKLKNPPKITKGKWVSAHAIRFRHDGGVDLMY